MDITYNSVTSSNTISRINQYPAFLGNRQMNSQLTDVIIESEQRPRELFSQKCIDQHGELLGPRERATLTFVSLHNYPYPGSDALVDKL